jgi:hypothetical protein
MTDDLNALADLAVVLAAVFVVMAWLSWWIDTRERS